jgi:hypothetical protein
MGAGMHVWIYAWIHRRNTQKKYTEEIHGMYDG